VRAYDIVPEALTRYAAEMEHRHGVSVRPCGGPREAMRGAQIVVTAGPIEPKAIRAIEPGWLEPGALGIALDYDCYWQAAALRATDGFYTDDGPQLVHLKEYGYFVDAPPVTAELGDVVAGIRPGRSRDDERIVTVNMGVAVEDVVTARRIYEAARAQGRDRPILPVRTWPYNRTHLRDVRMTVQPRSRTHVSAFAGRQPFPRNAALRGVVATALPS
jgi:ornithine cyclodeaminase/alanine dehydrogenase-like protein (mu-crystallin family)